MKKIWCIFVCFCLLFTAYGVQAAYITFNNEIVDDMGTGVGNVLQSLVVKQKPPDHSTTEWGSVLWDGSSDVLTDAESQSQTVTVAQLAAEGFDESNLIVILNLNQTGSHPELDVHSFTMRSYTSLDGLSYFDAVYDIDDVRNAASTLALSPEGNGLGAGQAGYVFRITFADTEGADFFGNSAHRIGMFVDEARAMGNKANAGTMFYMSDADVNEIIPIPEPATLAVLLISAWPCWVIDAKPEQVNN